MLGFVRPIRPKPSGPQWTQSAYTQVELVSTFQRLALIGLLPVHTVALGGAGCKLLPVVASVFIANRGRKCEPGATKTVRALSSECGCGLRLSGPI